MTGRSERGRRADETGNDLRRITPRDIPSKSEGVTDPPKGRQPRQPREQRSLRYKGEHRAGKGRHE